MKLVIATVLVAAGLTAPAWAQGAADTLTQAAKEAATQAVTDGIHKAAGTDASQGKADKKSKKDKEKAGPNLGQSEDHRQDDANGHKGKKNKR